MSRCAARARHPSPRVRRRSGGPTRRYEGVWRRRGLAIVAGVDEVGRGCLAGPVVAAAVILGERVPRGVDDSKRLSTLTREFLFNALQGSEARLAVGLAGPWEIDRVNIREASFLAMRRALSRLPEPPQALLVDGFSIPGLEIPQRALVRGDARSLSIAAASIIAKVTRDRMMVQLARRFPVYGFDRHKGYPTAEHLHALERHGPCRLHRRSFGPVRLAAQASLPPLPGTIKATFHAG